jgi:hypothetical protein
MPYSKFRVIIRNKNRETCYQIHQVEFDDEGNVTDCAKKPFVLSSDDLFNFKEMVYNLQSAFRKPMLEQKRINGRMVITYFLLLIIFLLSRFQVFQMVRQES